MLSEFCSVFVLQYTNIKNILKNTAGADKTDHLAYELV